MTQILKDFKNKVPFETIEERRKLTIDIIKSFKSWNKEYSTPSLETLHEKVLLNEEDYKTVRPVFMKIIKKSKKEDWFPQWFYTLIDQVCTLEEILSVNPEYTHSKHTKRWDPERLSQIEYLKRYKFLIIYHDKDYLSVLADYYKNHDVNIRNENLLTTIFATYTLQEINDLCVEYPILFERMMPLKPQRWWLSKKTDIYDRFADESLIYASFISNIFLKKVSNVSQSKLERYQALFPGVTIHKNSNLQYFHEDRNEVMEYLGQCLSSYKVKEVKTWTLSKFPELSIIASLDDETFKSMLLNDMSHYENISEVELHL